MQRLIIVICFVWLSQNTNAQSPMPNANIPLPLMVPVKQNKNTTKAIAKKVDCSSFSKMISFHLPCCLQIDSAKAISDIAMLAFDSSGCKKPAIHFIPEVITALSDFETIQVFATDGEDTLTTSINVTKPSNKPLKKSFPLSFEDEAEQYKAMMERLKNNSEPAAETSGNTFPTGDLNYISTYSCCDSSTVCFVENKKFSGAYTWDFEITAHIPLYGIAAAKSLDGIIIGLATLKATIHDETNCAKKQPCVDINGEVSIGGKVSRILPENIIESDIRLQTNISYHPNECNKPEQKINNQKFSCRQMQVKGKITAGWGLVTHTFDYTMYSTKEK